MLTLYEHPLSPYARKVKICLYEKGVPFERRFVNPYEPDAPDFQEFVKASPRLEVPVLVDGEVRVFDSTIMADYVEERFPEPALFPKDPAERARVRMLEEICDTELEAVNWGVMEVMFFRRATGTQAERILATAREQHARLFARLERELEGRPWMNGARFGRGDAAVYPHVNPMALQGHSFPRLADWLARAGARASVARDAAELGEFMRQAGMGAGGTTEPPKLQRQYRDHRLEWMMKSGGVDVVIEGLRSQTIKFANEHG